MSDVPEPWDETRARAEVLGYHQSTKHNFARYARGPRGLDWATQPDPFLRFEGAKCLPLDHIPRGEDPPYEAAFVEGNIPPADLNRASVSQLFGDSLALSAWKQAGTTSWPLRINPSSGNLHPTEGYLVCGPIEGLCSSPMVAHYAPREHALECRTGFEMAMWRTLAHDCPAGTVFVGLTSIHWREAWKYGERAYRYCQHDVGHAVAAITMAAAGLGWRVSLLDGLATSEVAMLLGVAQARGPEAEVADCLLMISPQGAPVVTPPVTRVPDDFAALTWVGQANALSPEHVAWPSIDRVSRAAAKPAVAVQPEPYRPTAAPLVVGDEPISLRKTIFARRSAVALDGHTGLASDGLFQLLRKLCVGPSQFPFNALPWSPNIDLVLFVHRVGGLDPGVYCLVRDPSRLERLRAAFHPEFAWDVPESCPEGLALYCLERGDARDLSAQISCHQDIAADGCFSLAMLADFEAHLETTGPWMYPRLFWECGVIGQVLYLEAEALGIRGTGIGCFFDDPVHKVLGLDDRAFQSLYHFTVGGPVEDKRLRTLPAYGQ